ncbi:glutathione S-transferase N-terminal domain-containing protein [Conexibacter stalactiti]|uniref:Glutathione S-transferase N-terminal domain-containing protein n=1 Tax=Conexibacter stalactiti TaxID=1940611 RepID=A0ABU4HYY3_9ACTN|nr:glutathione S-transferase N-terminal domain-containing protein [Conexibacter stalactiti]MDW5598533.1 glutathione S-transferase N-terminal domain-containing protein [Conexibacter stalactiti]MEC5039175.1 glutathione S-transferase N-terminal domain-containing protein [Conexibacter stalactiti]
MSGQTEQETQAQGADAGAGADAGGIPTLYVCHGDDQGPRVHPCKRVQDALREAGIEYTRVTGGHGHPISFLRRGSRERVRQATGDVKLPALVLADGTVLTHSKEILRWVAAQG